MSRFDLTGAAIGIVVVTMTTSAVVLILLVIKVMGIG